MEAANSHSQRMNDLFEQAVRSPIVLIEAGPGYGKSELLESFLEKGIYNHAWLRLRRMDNHLFFNWKKLTQSLKKLMPNQSDAFSKLETPTTLGQIAELIELIEAASLETQRSVFVIDDYSILEEENVRFLYESLVESDFSNLCLVILSNQKSDLHSLCIRSTIDYFSIDETNLRLTEGETADLFHANALSLKTEQLAKLSERWQGWPLPLYMLAKSCRDSEEIMQQSQDVLLQLFHTQFFQEYPLNQKRSLIQLALLDVIPPELFELFDEAVVAMLKKHPLITYDYKNDVYTLQTAYRDFLKARQTLIDQEETRSFYQKAAEVFLKRERDEEALAMFVESRQYDQVVALIWRMLTPFTEYSQAKFLYDHSEKIPKKYFEEHPRAELQNIGLLLSIGKVHESDNRLTTLIKRLESEDFEDKTVLGDAYHMLAQNDRLRGDESFLEHTRLASIYLPEGMKHWNKPVPVILKAPWARFPCYEEGVPDQIEHAKQVFRTLNSYITTILGGLDIHADVFCQAEIAYFQYDLKQAKILLLELLHAAESEQLYESMLLVRHFLMRTELLKGELSEAESQLTAVTRLIQEQELYQYNGFQARMASWLALYLHSPDDVPTRVVKNDIEKGAKWELARNGFPQAKYLIQKNRYDEALALLNYLERYYSNYKGLWMDVMYAKTFRAITYLKMNEHDLAIADLEAVYHLTHGNNIITPLIEWEEDMRHLIHVAQEKAPEAFDPEWLRLVGAKATTLAKRVSKIRKQKVAEKNSMRLTPRRLEILKDLAEGLTSEEIAEKKELSIHTVHSHIKNIYNDLGVSNRIEAIRIAEQKRLL
ncbi:LuxR C-terminal-related transcriptional regulator [Enterococcus gilvus]|uniref:helix-turn-helix transcriptional regulator n=1 Tax=Enterococcus gilvus TaxID=160453 RepID=UPI0028D398EF|nr:LuxR C-terminal-related transcriptional regulator [Enterococcus gilvus]